MVTKGYTHISKPGIKSCRFVGVHMTFCYHQTLKVQSWKLKNFWKIIAYMIEVCTENFTFQLFAVLQLFAVNSPLSEKVIYWQIDGKIFAFALLHLYILQKFWTSIFYGTNQPYQPGFICSKWPVDLFRGNNS